MSPQKLLCMKVFIYFISLLFASFSALSQSPTKKEKVLFTVAGEPILSEEFIYLFNKNHQQKPEQYTIKNIEEYISLYTKFKLKVKEARIRGYDTTAKFKDEFAGYKEALRKPYLPDTKLTDSLARMAYERLQTEVKASHILIRIPENATPNDTSAAWNKIKDIEQKLKNGDDFASLAVQFSEDPSAKTNEGNLGYFSAFQMVYPFETGAFQTPVGQVSTVVRTRFGYHLIKVLDKRSAQGEVEVSHIMVRLGNGRTSEQAKEVAFEIYDRLNAGMNWDELCRTYSEDANSKDSGGKLRPFGTGAFASVPEFEAAAFSLTQPGTYTAPFSTAYGWHIVKLERKIPVGTFAELEASLKNRVSRDERMQNAKRIVQQSLRKKYSFKEFESAKSKLYNLADSTLQQGRWNPPITSFEKEVLFSLQNSKVAVKDFVAYVKKNQRQTKVPSNQYLQQLQDNYIQQKIEELVEADLTKNNPEYRYLSQEYYEGILLFDIMEKEVWAKASNDSTGLEQYYQAQKQNYTGNERANIIVYQSADQKSIDAIALTLQNQQEIKSEFLKQNNIKKEEGKFQKGERNFLAQIPWQKGNHPLALNGNYYLVQLIEVLPAGILPLDEVRGKVIGDYQITLENDWLKILEKKYPVKMNAKAKKYVLSALVKK